MRFPSERVGSSVGSSGGRRLRVRRYRRLAYSLGWLAALVLAASAGWKTS
jgi:hypothetical protein